MCLVEDTSNVIVEIICEPSLKTLKHGHYELSLKITNKETMNRYKSMSHQHRQMKQNGIV